MTAATKRKRSNAVPFPGLANAEAPPLKRRASSRLTSTAAVFNPNINGDVLDAPNAIRASPDSEANSEAIPGTTWQTKSKKSESPLSDAPAVLSPPRKKTGREGLAAAQKEADEADAVVSAVVDVAKRVKAPSKKAKLGKVKQEDDDNGAVDSNPVPAKKAKKGEDQEVANRDPEADGDEEGPDEEEVKEALSRPPPVNSDYLPLPWKGRLGYACLNTYLRNSNPPVFSSRTCRIQSILEHRHPLQDPTQPEHPTKNKPDRSKPADPALGLRYVEALCLANVKDIAKMIRWNDRYNIKFLRLSSEMFPFASHPEYGYKLAPFASEALAEAGKVIAEFGHRVTTHPGQFTQLGSPRKQVIDNAIRDLEYHDEMLTLLKLPEQQDRDAVMILHMGGIFDGKEQTIARFKENYADLSQSIKNRLVLENDDMGWSVHDLLPVCEELNIPLVLDYHHHNIVFDSSQIREGTKAIMALYPRITATWQRKGIKQKMHYSEPTPSAITPRQRRKHSPRVATLPPCPPDMDLMIEAKDKEQAVFELMRTFKLPGFDTFNDVLPYTRTDDNKAALATLNRRSKTKADEPDHELIPEEEVGMGGPEGRVYWPPGMEEWLRPKKREIKKKDPSAATKSKDGIKKQAEAAYRHREAEKAAAAAAQEGEDLESDLDATPATKKAKAAMRKKERADRVKAAAKKEVEDAKKAVKEAAKARKEEVVATPLAKKRRKAKKEEEVITVPTPSPNDDDGKELDLGDEEEEDGEVLNATLARNATATRKPRGRQAKGERVRYAEKDDEQDM